MSYVTVEIRDADGVRVYLPERRITIWGTSKREWSRSLNCLTTAIRREWRNQQAQPVALKRAHLQKRRSYR